MSSKRTFQEIRTKILKSLKQKPKSITAVSKNINSNWITAYRHLIWLERVEGKVKKVKESKREIIYKLKNER